MTNLPILVKCISIPTHNETKSKDDQDERNQKDEYPNPWKRRAEI